MNRENCHWLDIRKRAPEDGELVLIYDSKDYNGLGIKYFIGTWDEYENAFIHHTGYKYAGDYWMRLYPPKVGKE